MSVFGVCGSARDGGNTSRPTPDTVESHVAPAIDLVLFEHRSDMVRKAFHGGITSFIVDCENHGKKARQEGFDTEVNCSRPEDLVGINAQAGATAFCRIDHLGDNTRVQIDRAIRYGADVILLPMVTEFREAEQFLRLVEGRCRAGILIETQAAVRAARDIAKLPLDCVYVGLNDLMISRGGGALFDPIVDGTLYHLREAFERIPFGFGGLTAVDRGAPIPCLMLLQEMARLHCRFSFLRRSFKRDVTIDELPNAVSAIRESWKNMLRRSPSETQVHHDALCSRINALSSGHKC